MQWIKVKAKDYEINVPFGKELLASNGDWVKYVNQHGWDKDVYYFHDGTGKLEGVTHWMLLPACPEKQDN